MITSLAFPHDLDATLYDLQLPLHTSASDRLGWGGVGWDVSVSDISTWSWFYALWSSLAFPHDLDATLYDLPWHFHMILMLRSMIFIGISTWSWCYALWSSLAFPHDLDATLYDLHWQFHMILMLRSMIFNCHFHMILILRSMIFIGISTWSWCYALWSSLAFPHDLDATLYDLQLPFPHDLDSTLYDLHWHFHMILMLRSMIFIGISTWSWCYALWSSLASPHDLDGNHRWHVEENLRKSCGCPFSGWSHGRVVIHKVDGPFFWRGFQWKKTLLAVTK